ncbi:MAG: autotransporter-associated beta strand repeat-containing protein [Phycisphaerales bacterium]
MSLGTSSAITGAINGGAGTDSLTLNGAGTIGIDQITGFETLAKEGAGTWTLTGTGSAGGPIAVNGGTLAVAGNVGDAVNVGTLGTLKGGGEVGSLTDNGLVAPGNSAGTLAVNRDYTLGGPGVLEIEIGGFGAGESDLLDGVGEADLAGGTIRLKFLDGYDISGDLPPGQSASLMFLEADGGIGEFASTISYDFPGTPGGFTYDVYQQGNGLWFQATNANDPQVSAVPLPGGVLLAAIGVGLIGGIRRRTV